MIEMLVVMTIMAILLAIGVPNMTDFFRTNRLDAATNELVATLNLARSEAIRRGVTVSVQRHAVTSGLPNGIWDEGWKVDVGGTEIRRAESPSPLTVRARANANDITFDARGAVNTASLLVICNDDALSRSRVVVVNTTGRIRVVSDGGAAKVDDDAKALTSCTNPAPK